MFTSLAVKVMKASQIVASSGRSVSLKMNSTSWGSDPSVIISRSELEVPTAPVPMFSSAVSDPPADFTVMVSDNAGVLIASAAVHNRA